MIIYLLQLQPVFMVDGQFLLGHKHLSIYIKTLVSMYTIC